MNSEYKRQRFTTYLSSVPCTPELRERITRIAKLEDVSVAEILRYAAETFAIGYETRTAETAERSTQVGAEA